MPPVLLLWLMNVNELGSPNQDQRIRTTLFSPHGMEDDMRWMVHALSTNQCPIPLDLAERVMQVTTSNQRNLLTFTTLDGSHWDFVWECS